VISDQLGASLQLELVKFVENRIFESGPLESVDVDSEVIGKA